MSEFIEHCQDLLKQHGDLEVTDDSGRTADIDFVEEENELPAAFVVV